MATEQITEQQVNQVLNAMEYFDFADYARNYYNASNLYLTPDIVNQQMKNVGWNQVNLDVEQLEKALKNAKASENILADYAATLEVTDMMFKRLTSYYPNMAAFNLTFDAYATDGNAKFTSKQYKADQKKLEEFLYKFDYKEEFSRVIRQMFRNGVCYVVLRRDGDKYTLQELPKEFCKITGRFSEGYLFDFNMMWFLNNYGVDINMYPRVFKSMLDKVMIRNKNAYDPAKRLNDRKTGFVYWEQTSPVNGFWCFKLEPELATILPYYAGLMPTAIYQPVIRGLQRDKYFIQASKMLVGILGFNKEQKSGQVTNNVNMTPEVLGKFLGVARQGLDKQIKLAALPVDDVKTVDFEVSATNVDMDYSSSVVKQAVASSDVLFGTEKLNSHQSKLASAIDCNVVKKLYPMFENFMSFYVNRLTTDYKFKIKFNDMNVPDQLAERKSVWETETKLGLVDLQLLARCNDMDVFELTRALKISQAFGIDKFITPIGQLVSGGTQSATSSNPTGLGGKVGRPAKEDSDNENTEASWARGSNDLK